MMTRNIWMLSILLFLVLARNLVSSECIARRTAEKGSSDSFYCVCNSGACDGVPEIAIPNINYKNSFKLVTSNRDQSRFAVSNGTFGNVKVPLLATKIIIDSSEKYQEVIGFGGAITDSVGLNLNKLSAQTRNQLLKAYFSPEGIEYNLVRVPMGASDFSKQPYSYAMTPKDIYLRNFSLATEDHVYKLRNLRAAQDMSRRDLKFITAPWACSLWMKEKHNDDWSRRSSLKKEYWLTWAEYFARFLKEYEGFNVRFWALSPQNEPEVNVLDLLTSKFTVEWDPEDMRDFIVRFLNPVLKRHGLGYVKLLIGDGARSLLPSWPKKIMKDQVSKDLVSGIAVHSYKDHVLANARLEKTHKQFPDKFLLYTESAAGESGWNSRKVLLGSWKRAEEYASNIIEAMSNWVTGWMDFNIALDLQGGPNWMKKYLDSPIIVNHSADEFYKQPMYYVMGHFSKYIPPGSYRIGTNKKGTLNSGIKTIGFQTPQNTTVVVILNTYSTSKNVYIEDPRKGKVKLTVAAKSIQNIIYR